MGAFGRRFEFLFPGMLSSGIAFPGMYFLEHLVDGLNSQEYFVHFQKYPWWSNRETVAKGDGPVVARLWLAIVRRRRATVDGYSTLSDGGLVEGSVR